MKSILRIIVPVVLLIVIFGIAVSSIPTTGDSPKSPATVSSRITVTATPRITVTKKMTPTPSPVMGDGVWLVGTDISTGRYRTISQVEGGCYWEIDSSPGGEIVDNDLPSGGRPTVNLKAGQQFTSKDCGSWSK